MTIDQAIKELTEMQKLPRNIPTLPGDIAIGLGLEALKRLRVGRRAGHPYFTAKLPGETES